jgi:hypothetical protein
LEGTTPNKLAKQKRGEFKRTSTNRVKKERLLSHRLANFLIRSGRFSENRYFPSAAASIKHPTPRRAIEITAERRK